MGEMASVSNVGRAADRRIPLIGIPTFDTVVAADRMDGARCFHFGHDRCTVANKPCAVQGDVNEGKSNQAGYGAKLDQNHHVFLLYAHPRTSETPAGERFWGKEEKFRDEFENYVRENCNADSQRNPFRMTANVFSVLVVIEGGPVTLKIAETAAVSGKPVVVVEGSGRAADAIAYVWRFLHDKRPLAKNTYTQAGIRAAIQRVGSLTDEAIDEDFGRILRMVCVRSKITLCTLDETSNGNCVAVGLDKAIHAAIHRAIPFCVRTNTVEAAVHGKSYVVPRSSSEGTAALISANPFAGTGARVTRIAHLGDGNGGS